MWWMRLSTTSRRQGGATLPPSAEAAYQSWFFACAGGFSGAELANVVDEAACLAARQGAEVVQLKELVEAVSRTRFGISGGNAGIAPVQGLRKRFNDWLVELMSSSRRVQSSPMGQ